MANTALVLMVAIMSDLPEHAVGYCNIPVSIGILLAAWLVVQDFSQMVSMFPS